MPRHNLSSMPISPSDADTSFQRATEQFNTYLTKEVSCPPLRHPPPPSAILQHPPSLSNGGTCLMPDPVRLLAHAHDHVYITAAGSQRA